MLATAGTPPTGDRYAVEPKFDGVRCCSRVGAAHADLFSRAANNLTASFPEVARALASVGARDMILDGEVIVLDRKGRPDFARLQRRLHVSRPPSTLQSAFPARLVVFDVLHLQGQDLTSLPYVERRSILEGLHLGATVPELATTPMWTGIDGTEVLEAMVAAGMEGVVTKALSSPYQAGRRSRHWIKTPYRHSGPFVIGGFTAAKSAHEIGSLLVGAHDDDGQLIYCANVTVGFTARARRDLHAVLAPLACPVSPFSPLRPVSDADHVQWVTPRVVGRVEYREYTGRLRHPAWKGAIAADAVSVALPTRR